MYKLIQQFHNSFIPPLLFVAILWIIMLSQFTFALDLQFMGVLPRSFEGLLGVFTAPLVHSNFKHLMSNSLPLLVMGTTIFYFYPKPAIPAIILIYVASGALVWVIARPAYHIGASGLVYGFATFLIFNGFFRKDRSSLAIALLTVFIYGGIVWGIFPGEERISWESHLAGALVGLLSAYLFRNLDPPKQPMWEDDEEYEHLNYKDIYRQDNNPYQ